MQRNNVTKESRAQIEIIESLKVKMSKVIKNEKNYVSSEAAKNILDKVVRNSFYEMDLKEQIKELYLNLFIEKYNLSQFKNTTNLLNDIESTIYAIKSSASLDTNVLRMMKLKAGIHHYRNKADNHFSGFKPADAKEKANIEDILCVINAKLNMIFVSIEGGKLVSDASSRLEEITAYLKKFPQAKQSFSGLFRSQQDTLGKLVADLDADTNDFIKSLCNVENPYQLSKNP